MTEEAPVSAPRRLLARVRDIMAGSGNAEERLNKIVQRIAHDMVAEVCSCYIMRAGEVLELFATQGLRQDAVHQTRLRVGEGLIGVIAAQGEPLVAADAQNHPGFVYRPETGEEIYHSMLGVPIRRDARVMGVLAVQNREARAFSDEEMETLETVAMVVAELIAGNRLVDPDELVQVEGNALLPLRLEGARLTGGLGIGRAVLHRPRVHVQKLVADDPDRERRRLRAAMGTMHRAIDAMLAQASEGEHSDILEAYAMFARDTGWVARIEEAIDTGLTAEAAVQRVHDDTRARMLSVNDPYIRERLHDLEDLTNRLLQHLAGREGTAAGTELPPDTVLVARSMGPAELLDYDQTSLRGVVLEEGGPNSHVAIVARALDIPVVGRARDAVARVESGDRLIVDGDNAQVFIRPGEDVLAEFTAAAESRAEQRAAYAALSHLPAVTLDGVRVNLMLNAGVLLDLGQLAPTGADGIGLYRTELGFMVRSSLPTVEEQAALYAKVLEQSGERPVVFRTLDIGGDKVLPYWDPTAEDNPAMGWRSMRITLDRPLILRHQFRALIRAAAGRALNIMLPMIAEVAEFDFARDLLDKELARERTRGTPPPRAARLGTMLEVPALTFHLEALLRRVDFVSVGSNDLFQFLYAADRANPRVAERYDPLGPTMLRFLHHVVTACRAAGVPVTLCGEMAGRPLDALALLGLGYRSLSMPGPAVGPVKAMVRHLDLTGLEDFVRTQLDSPARSVRPALKGYARDHGVPV